MLTAVAAVPVKRELVVNTITQVDVVTEMVTATVWVDATDTQTYHEAQYTRSAEHPYSAPAVATHAVPTTTTLALSTTSSSVYVAPVPATTSTTSSTTSSSTSSTTSVVLPPVYTAPAAPVPTTTTTTSAYVAPPAPTTTSTSQYVAPTPVYTPPTEPATTSTTAAAAAAAQTSTSSSGGAGAHTGQLTYYDVGLGSCGYTNTDSEAVVAMAVGLMDKATMCGKSVSVTYGGVTKTAKIVDTCMGCADGNLDMSPTLFEAFAPLTSGRVSGATWSFV